MNEIFFSLYANVLESPATYVLAALMEILDFFGIVYVLLLLWWAGTVSSVLFSLYFLRYQGPIRVIRRMRDEMMSM